jgi:hypothetical protein
MENRLKDAIHQQRAQLAEILSTPLAQLAARCTEVWGHREAIDSVLSSHFADIPHRLFLYVVDTNGIQVSSNISATGTMPEHFGRDRSQRPYMKEVVPAWGFLFSDAYISRRARRPSLTALQVVRRGDTTVGYLGADFDLRDLPVTGELYEESVAWRQIKGDPAIRSTLFQQCRVESLMDRNIEPACAILEELLTERGMFQTSIHFSSNRSIIWLMDDPYRYRILDHEALIDPDVCLLYQRQPYPDNALIPKQQIGNLLNGMRELRMADETVYLRTSSINIFNGLVGLTFSCDGSHYMSWQEFLDKDIAFWLGTAA